MPTFADQAIEFYSTISINIPLPEGVEIMHPHLRPDVASVFETFFQKFYNDNQPRTFIIGINPGRFGGGITGIPFTDPIKLKNYCGIDHPFENKTELSADFIYQVIDLYGGPEKFYRQFYFTALSPLGFTYKGVN
ncbi:MAG TPA: uracil-DNA glycosylase family protein, partial [Daejeonella sp.]|nr:uracil-DNA glycosylase family protein [Daejeonella sp.]